jgi:hypothetical protein
MARIAGLPPVPAAERVPQGRTEDPPPEREASPPVVKSVKPVAPGSAGPAADDAAEQMRKLRRDSKRRAMGGA